MIDQTMKCTTFFKWTSKAKTAFPLAALFLLSACSELLVTDAISTIATDKTIGDHVISYVSKKDCSTIRSEQGMTYCKEDDPRLKKDPKRYCYHELGKVTCYEQADLNSVRRDIEDKKEPVPSIK